MCNHFSRFSLIFLVLSAVPVEAQENPSISKTTSLSKEGESPRVQALNQELLQAVHDADLARTKTLLKQGASANTTTPEGKTLISRLFERVMVLDRQVLEEIVNLLIDNGADVHVIAGLHTTYLHESAGNNLLSSAKRLLDKGIDTTVKSLPGENTAIFYADSVEMAQLLLKKRPDSINDLDEYGNSLLHNACGVRPVPDLVKFYSKVISIEKINSNGQTPLMMAVDWEYLSEEREKVIEFLLAQNADLNAQDKKQRSLLMIALKNTKINPALVKKIIDAKPDINIRDNTNSQAIHYAAMNSLDNFKLVDGADADLNSQNQFGETPLTIAVRNGNTPVVEYLIGRRVDINKADKHGKTALNYALEFDAGDIIVLLQQAKAKANSKVQIAKIEKIYLSEEKEKSQEVHNLSDAIREKKLAMVKSYFTSMHQENAMTQEILRDALFAAVQSGNLEIFQFLLDNGGDIHAVDEEGFNLLHEAVFADRMDVVKYLVGRGLDINATVPSEQAMLRMATNSSVAMLKFLVGKGLNLDKKLDAVKFSVLYDKPEVARYLLTLGFSFNKRLLDNNKLLVEVFKTGSPGTLSFLRENGLDIDKPIEFRMDKAPPLYYTLVFNNKNMAISLINAGAKLSGRVGNQETIFSYVINLGDMDVFNAYYDRGASLTDTAGIFKRTPLFVAIDLQRVDTIQALIKRGANVNERDMHEGDTPLHHAARLGYLETVKLLIRKGADPKARNQSNQTPLDVAIQFEKKAVTELLQKQTANKRGTASIDTPS